MRIRSAIVVAVVLALIAGAATLVLWPSGPTVTGGAVPAGSVDLAGGVSTEVSIGNGWSVRVPAGGVPPTGGRLDIAPVPAQPSQFGTTLSPVVDLRLSTGQPTAPWTFVLRLPQPLPADSTVVLVSERDAPPGQVPPAEILPVQWNADRTEGTVAVDHLSVKWFEKFASDVVAKLGKLIGQRTDPPRCEGEEPDWVDEAIFLRDDANAPLLTCVGSDPAVPSTAVVKIANNRGATLVVRSPSQVVWAYQQRRFGSLDDVPAELLAEALDRVAEGAVTRGQTWLVQPGEQLHLGFSEDLVRASGEIPFTVSGSYTITGVALGLVSKLAIDELDRMRIRDKVFNGIDYAIAVACLPLQPDNVTNAIIETARCVLEKPEVVLAPLRSMAGGLPDGTIRAATAIKSAMRALMVIEYGGIVLPDLLTTLQLERGALEVNLFTTTPRPTAVSGGTDLRALWARWQQLNDICRGTPDGGGADACPERDSIMEQHARGSSSAFLAAWRAGDSGRMQELSSDDATDTFGRPLVDSLLAFTPAEDNFDFRYDVQWSGVVSAYVTTEEGPDLYFEWTDDYDRGWVVQTFAPDVG